MRRFWIADWGLGIGRGEMREVPGGSAASTFHLLPSTSTRPSRRAFTLIELLGVMAIIGILSAVTLPPLISRIEDANSVGEDAKLEEIARALVKGIQAEGRIPNPNVNPTAAGGWAAMATNYSVLGTNDLILSVRRAANETVRRYFLSPALTNFLGGIYSPPAGGWSTNNFTNGPFYLMLVSVSKDGLLFGNGCTTNTNMASNNVVFLQNWAKTNNTNGRVAINNLDIVGNIAGTSNRWTNRGEFLHVKTIDVRSIFCAVTLTDFPVPTGGQTTSSGSGFTPNTPYQGQAAGCSFNFTAPAPTGAVVVGFETDPPTVTTNVAVGSKTMILRTGAPTTSGGVIPPADRSIASLNARNTLAAKLLNGPYLAASRLTNPAVAAAVIAAENINTEVNSTVPVPTGLTTLQNTYNSAKVASDAAQAAAEAEKIRDPGNATAPDNATLDSTAAAASQATASALAALQTAQAASSAQTTANANALQDASANAIRAADTEFKSGGTPQSIASAAANAAANAAAAQVVTTPATFSMTIDQPPYWSIGALAGQQMPTVGNIQTFYVLKGTTLALYAAGAAPPAGPILTVQINADSKFEYFNGSWTRVD